MACTLPPAWEVKGIKNFRKAFAGGGGQNFCFGVCVYVHVCLCVCEGGGGQGLLTRFAPFSYLNHSFILSLNVRICVRFIVFLQISLCFLICQELCWIRGLCIYFISSCFLFPVGGRELRWS